MPAVYGSCDTPVIAPVCNACGEDNENAGVRGAAFIHASVIAQIKANPNDSVLWNTLITSGKIFVLPDLRGTYNSAPNYVAGFGNKSQYLSNFTHTVEFDDVNYKNNCGFYNSIMNSDKYYFAFRSGSTIRISDVPVEVVSSSPIVDDVNALVTWHAIVTWNSRFVPCPTETPEGVFICTEGANSTLFPIDTGDGSYLEAGNGEVIEYA